jgi:hypothetical protein
MSRETEKNFAKRVDWKPLKYEPDNNDLYPTVTPPAPAKRLPIQLADSTDIAIKTSSVSINLVAEKLPEISLSGKLKVSSLEESYDTTAPEEVNLPSIPLPEFPRSQIINQAPLSPKRAIHLSLPAELPQAADGARSHFKSTTVKTPVSFAPKSITEAMVIEESDTNNVFTITLITTSGVLVVCLLLLIFGEIKLEATATSYTWALDFSPYSLTALVSLFPH